MGELAQALLENPLFNSALGRALGAGERAASAQRSAIGALNLASASDVERLEQRLRSLSGRLEAIEDRLDELADELARARGSSRQAAGDAADQRGSTSPTPRAEPLGALAQRARRQRRRGEQAALGRPLVRARRPPSRRRRAPQATASPSRVAEREQRPPSPGRRPRAPASPPARRALGAGAGRGRGRS